MIIFAYFTDSGTPKTGLTPTIDVWEPDGTHLINSVNMDEVGGGFYKYTFAVYDESEDYCMRADGGSVLSNYERYVQATNEIPSNLKTIQDYTTRILGLSQENYRISDSSYTTYNKVSQLTSATIKIYESASDCEADINEIATYSIAATYDRNGNMTDYKVVKQ